MQFCWSEAGKFRTAINSHFGIPLIVAAAKSVSCRFLLTEDLQSGQDFDGLLVVNPFLRDPASLTT